MTAFSHLYVVFVPFIAERHSVSFPMILTAAEVLGESCYYIWLSVTRPSCLYLKIMVDEFQMRWNEGTGLQQGIDADIVNSIWFFRIAINLITGFANTQNWCTTRSCSWFRCCGSVLLCWYFKGCSSAGTLAHRYRHTASCNLMKEPAMLVEIVVYLWRILHARYHLWRSVAWHDIDGRTANRWSCDIAN